MGEPKQTRRPVIALDLLRGLAAVMVLVVHVRGGSFVEFGALPQEQRSTAVAVFFGVTRLGQEAVMVFFVLSGFLVGGQLIERARSGTFVLRRYAVDRCTRIFLPLVPACLLTLIISAAILGEGIGLLDLIGNMIGLNGFLVPTLPRNFPLWSLAYEIWFYIVGGAVAYLAARGRSVVAIAVLAAAALVFSQLVASFLLYWAFGAAMVIFRETERKGCLFVAGLMLIALGTALHELAFPTKSFVNVSLVPIEVARGMLCIGVAITLPFLCSTRVDKALYRLRWLAQSLAAGSYTLYLTHYPINAALDQVLPKADALSWEGWEYFAARIVICSLAAIAMYFCFERHTGTLRRWMTESLYVKARTRNSA